jgi:hypothetical protein
MRVGRNLPNELAELSNVADTMLGGAEAPSLVVGGLLNLASKSRPAFRQEPPAFRAQDGDRVGSLEDEL